MFKKSGVSKFISFAIIVVMLCGMFTFSVSAAAPIVLDFSKYDDVLDILAAASGGQGEFDVVKDGDRFVLFAECVDGFDPAEDDASSTKGDLYTSIVDFEDLNLDADVYQWMKLGVRNPSNAPGFEVHFSSPTKGYNVETSITFDIKPNSDYTSYIYNITEQCKKYYPKRAGDVGDPDVYPDHWHGHINQFRLDFMYYEESGGHARTGDKIYVEYIAFFDSEQAAKDFVFKPARGSSNTDGGAAAPAAAGGAGIVIGSGVSAIKAVDFDSGVYGWPNGDGGGKDVRENEEVNTEWGDNKATEFGGNIGWTDKGSWVQWTVNVEADGKYKFETWLASDNGNNEGISFYYDGALIGSVDHVDQEGWQAYNLYQIGEINMTAGTHVIKAEWPPVGGFNITAIIVTKTEGGAAAPVVDNAAAGGGGDAPVVAPPAPAAPVAPKVGDNMTVYLMIGALILSAFIVVKKRSNIFN